MLETRKNLLTEDQRKELEAKSKVEGQKLSSLKRDMNEVFSTGAGMNVLRWIMEQSGIFSQPVIVDRNTWDVKDKAMIYNGGRVSMYLAIRKLLSPSIVGPVENQGLAQDETTDPILT